MKLKPHGCSAECGKYFADRASLIKHERNIHGILRKKGISGASKKKPKREVTEVLVKEEDPEIVDLTHCELKRSPTPSLQESADSSREATCTPTTPALEAEQMLAASFSQPPIISDPFGVHGAGLSPNAGELFHPYQTPFALGYDLLSTPNPLAGIEDGSNLFNPAATNFTMVPMFDPRFAFYPQDIFNTNQFPPTGFPSYPPELYLKQLGSNMGFDTFFSAQPFPF